MKRVRIPQNLYRLWGRTDRPDCTFCNKKTWVVGGTIRYSRRQTKPGWDHFAYFGVLALNSGRGLEGDIQKAGGETPPASTLKAPSSRHLPPPPATSPPAALLPGGGRGAPLGEVPTGSRSQPRSKSGIRTSPVDQPGVRL